jgi:hypothetical protein
MALKVESDLCHTGLRNRGKHTFRQNVIKHSSQILTGSSNGRRTMARRIAGRSAGGHLAQMAQWSSLGSVMWHLGDKENPRSNGKIGGYEGGLYLHQRANNILQILD